jgi:hypothetical protein
MDFAVLSREAMLHVLVLSMETAVHNEAFVEKLQHIVRKVARQLLETAGSLMGPNQLALAEAVVP